MEIDDIKKLEYFKRLIKPYKKRGEEKYFINQYLSADGNELKSKFWSETSSSRLAFELYSWIAQVESVVDFEFEYKLKGIYRSPKKPNMDVFIETNDTVYFIESKYTEDAAQNLNGLSGSYYKEKGEEGAKNSRGEEVGSTLSERYYGKDGDAKLIKDFVEDIAKRLKGKSTPRCWMDYKQEVTHLIGIYLSLTYDKKALAKKKIAFYNIYYLQDVKTNDDIEYFYNKARILMSQLLPNVNFEYQHYTIQEVVDYLKTNYQNVNAFGKNEKVLDVLKKEFTKKKVIV